MNWISVDKQLPNYDEYVLWLYQDGGIIMECIDKDYDIHEFLNGNELIGNKIFWCRIEYPIEFLKGVVKMSLDFYLIQNMPTSVFDSNITHNLGKMWKNAGVYDALYNSEGKKAKEIKPIIEAGIKFMEENQRECEKYNSPNGWGTYEHALPWLREVLCACIKFPDAIIKISK